MSVSKSETAASINYEMEQIKTETSHKKDEVK